MFNNTNNNNHNHNHYYNDQFMGPRISFSSDFIDTNQQQLSYELATAAYKEAPVSSDFEFSVMGGGGGGSRLTPADEIFFQGKLLPATTTTTLREELMAGEGADEEEAAPRRSSGGGGRWMERLGLKKGRRHHRAGKGLETVEEEAGSQDASRKQQEVGAEVGGRQSFRTPR